MAIADSLSDTKAGSVKKDNVSAERRDANAVAYVEILDVAKALSTLSAEWRELEREVGAVSFFQSASWASVLQGWLQRSSDDAIDHDHQVVITRDQSGRLTGLWPIQVERILGAQFVVALGEPFNQYGDILVLPDVDRSVVFEAMRLSIRSLGRFSGILLRKVRDDAVCAQPLRNAGREMNASAAPAVDLRPFEGFEAYHKSVKVKTRKNLRNARNRLERDGGTMTHLVHTEPASIAEVVQRAFQLRTAWLEQEGLSSRAFMDDGFGSFIDALCDASREDDGMQLIAFELRLGDEMLSLQWGFISAGRYYAFMAVRNPGFDAHSPGRLHLENVIRGCAELNLDVVDFLAPDVAYKQTWATETIPVRDYGIAFTLAGYLVLFGAMGTPRKYARRLFDSLPQGFRQSAIRLLSRKSD